MRNQLLFIIIFLLTIATASAQATITENQITITSDKETYFCEAVVSPDGCLIKGEVQIHNGRVSPINAYFSLDANKDIRLREYSNNGLSLAVDKSEGRNIRGANLIPIAVNAVSTVQFQFYAKESGKFNYSVAFGAFVTNLDPFFNVSINTSSPVSHLINGTVISAADSLFGAAVNITNGLSDANDLTTFEVDRNKRDAKVTYSNFNNAQQSTYFLSGNKDSVLMNFTISPENAQQISAVRVCIQATKNQGTEKANVSIAYNVTNGNAPITLGEFPLPTSATPTSFSCKDVLPNYLPLFRKSSSKMYVGIQCGTCTGGSNRLVIGRENTNPQFDSTNEWSNSGQSWSVRSQDTLLFVNITYAGNESLGKAVRTTFPISFNTDNDYWLLTRKTSVGIANASVHLYNPSTDTVQTPPLISYTITTGDDTIPLPITQNITASLRLYTSTSHYIANTILIESVEDNEPPVINTKQVNDTILGCNESILLTANVTDDNFVQKVLFTWQDGDGVTVQEADRIPDTDIFFIEKKYTEVNNLNETYNFTLVNASDLVDQVTLDSSSDQYVYGCFEDIEEVPDLQLSAPSNNSISTSSPAQFSYTTNATTTNQLLINGLVNQTHVGNAGVNFYAPAQFLQNQSITWSVRTVSLLHESGTFNHVINLTQPPVPVASISLVSPLNVSVDPDGFVTFTFSVNVTGNASLHYISSLSPSVASPQTLVGVSGSQSFEPIQFLQNQTIQWWVNHSFNPVVMSEVFLLTINKTQFGAGELLPVPDDTFSIGVCSITDNVQSALAMVFFFTIAFVIIIIGKMFRIGIIGFFGSLMLFFLSLYVATCITFASIMIAAVGLMLMFHFVLRGFDNTL